MYVKLRRCLTSILFFFFNDTATTEIYTLSLHDALPISRQPRYQLAIERLRDEQAEKRGGEEPRQISQPARRADRKSTRLNSSHQIISYAVFCLKKKKNKKPSSYRAMPEARCAC